MGKRWEKLSLMGKNFSRCKLFLVLTNSMIIDLFLPIITHLPIIYIKARATKAFGGGKMKGRYGVRRFCKNENQNLVRCVFGSIGSDLKNGRWTDFPKSNFVLLIRKGELDEPMVISQRWF